MAAVGKDQSIPVFLPIYISGKRPLRALCDLGNLSHINIIDEEIFKQHFPDPSSIKIKPPKKTGISVAGNLGELEVIGEVRLPLKIHDIPRPFYCNVSIVKNLGHSFIFSAKTLKKMSTVIDLQKATAYIGPFSHRVPLLCQEGEEETERQEEEDLEHTELHNLLNENIYTFKVKNEPVRIFAKKGIRINTKQQQLIDLDGQFKELGTQRIEGYFEPCTKYFNKNICTTPGIYQMTPESKQILVENCGPAHKKVRKGTFLGLFYPKNDEPKKELVNLLSKSINRTLGEEPKYEEWKLEPKTYEEIKKNFYDFVGSPEVESALKEKEKKKELDKLFKGQLTGNKRKKL